MGHKKTIMNILILVRLFSSLKLFFAKPKDGAVSTSMSYVYSKSNFIYDTCMYKISFYSNVYSFRSFVIILLLYNLNYGRCCPNFSYDGRTVHTAHSSCDFFALQSFFVYRRHFFWDSARDLYTEFL